MMMMTRAKAALMLLVMGVAIPQDDGSITVSAFSNGLVPKSHYDTKTVLFSTTVQRTVFVPTTPGATAATTTTTGTGNALQVNRNERTVTPQPPPVPNREGVQTITTTPSYRFGKNTDIPTSTAPAESFLPSLTPYSPSYDEQRTNFIHGPYGNRPYSDTLGASRRQVASPSTSATTTTTDNLSSSGVYSQSYDIRRTNFINNPFGSVNRYPLLPTDTLISQQRQSTTSDSLTKLYYPNGKPQFGPLQGKGQLLQQSTPQQQQQQQSGVKPTSIPPGRISSSAWWLGPEAKTLQGATTANGYLSSYLKQGEKLSVSHHPPAHVDYDGKKKK